MPSPMDVVVLRPRQGVAIVECRGDHDLTTSKELEALLAEVIAENDLVVINLSEATFVDSSFLHNLVKAGRLARRSGSTMRLQLGSAPVVRTALSSSGLLTVLDEVSTRDEALERGS